MTKGTRVCKFVGVKKGDKPAVYDIQKKLKMMESARKAAKAARVLIKKHKELSPETDKRRYNKLAKGLGEPDEATLTPDQKRRQVRSQEYLENARKALADAEAQAQAKQAELHETAKAGESISATSKAGAVLRDTFQQAQREIANLQKARREAKSKAARRRKAIAKGQETAETNDGTLQQLAESILKAEGKFHLSDLDAAPERDTPDAPDKKEGEEGKDKEGEDKPDDKDKGEDGDKEGGDGEGEQGGEDGEGEGGEEAAGAVAQAKSKAKKSAEKLGKEKETLDELSDQLTTTVEELKQPQEETDRNVLEEKLREQQDAYEKQQTKVTIAQEEELQGRAKVANTKREAAGLKEENRATQKAAPIKIQAPDGKEIEMGPAASEEHGPPTFVLTLDKKGRERLETLDINQLVNDPIAMGYIKLSDEYHASSIKARDLEAEVVVLKEAYEAKQTVKAQDKLNGKRAELKKADDVAEKVYDSMAKYAEKHGISDGAKWGNELTSMKRFVRALYLQEREEILTGLTKKISAEDMDGIMTIINTALTKSLGTKPGAGIGKGGKKKKAKVLASETQKITDNTFLQLLVHAAAHDVNLKMANILDPLKAAADLHVGGMRHYFQTVAEKMAQIQPTREELTSLPKEFQESLDLGDAHQSCPSRKQLDTLSGGNTKPRTNKPLPTADAGEMTGADARAITSTKTVPPPKPDSPLATPAKPKK